MKISLFWSPCFRCLMACPKCLALPIWRRRRQAKMVFNMLKETFPGLGLNKWPPRG